MGLSWTGVLEWLRSVNAALFGRSGLIAEYIAQVLIQDGGLFCAT